MSRSGEPNGQSGGYLPVFPPDPGVGVGVSATATGQQMISGTGLSRLKRCRKRQVRGSCEPIHAHCQDQASDLFE